MRRRLTPGRAVLALALLPLGCDPEAASEDRPEATAPAEADAGSEASSVEGATHAAGTARAAAETDTNPPSGARQLRRPDPRPVAAVGRYDATPTTTTDRVGYAFQYDAPVFHFPSGARRIAGIVRRNTRVAIDRWVAGEGCAKSWYALVGGGYVCTGDGFTVSSDPKPLSEALQVEPPDVASALPYRYAKVKTPAPLYWRLPTEAELRSNSSAPVREQAQGAHFVAMDQRHTVGDATLHRTVRGFFVRDEDLEAKPAPTMEGQLLDGADDLPLAFVHVEDAALLDPATGDRTGTAERFARFAVAREEGGDSPRVLSPDGFALARDDVRVARVRERPPEVGAGEQWVHIDLDQQVLVAYEGDRPVLATLVSSGKEGFTPPLGVFRIHKKYTTVTMAGPDPDAGTYAVEQVPWTMYYWGSYALHGAYWHDGFGNVRSHGCTNIPPIDARWLFYWSQPELPPGWHAEVGLKGPWVWFTQGAALPDPAPSAAVEAAGAP